MQLKDLFERLSVGELSNLAIGQEGAGDIRAKDKKKVLTHVNSALLEVYSRFILSTKIVTVEMVGHITNYHLLVKYAESQNQVQYPYIKDMPSDPFKGDVIRVLEVYGEHGYHYPLNDDGNCHSLFTPAPLTLQIPNPVAGNPVYITYQARHVPLTTYEGTEYIDIPFILEDALQSYVAYKIFSHMNTQEAMIKSQEHMAMYERRCTEVEEKDLVRMSATTSISKLTQRGFV